MKENKVTAVSLVIIVIFIVGVVVKLAKPVLFPLSLAIFLSFILSPILIFFSRFKIPRFVSILFIVLISFFMLYLMGSLFYSSGDTFAAEFPKYGEKIGSILSSIQEKFKISGLEWVSVDWKQHLNVNKIGNFLLSTLGPFLGFLSNLFLIFIFLVFILAGKGKIKLKIQRSLSELRAHKIIGIMENIDQQIQRYLAIKTVVSLITGILATAVFIAFGVDFAILFGITVFLLNYIPTIGSIISTLLPFIVTVFQFETLWPAFWVFVFLTIIQQTMGSFVEPRLLGEGLGLSPLLVLFSLFFWGWLWGIPGMILAVPIASMVKIICTNIPSLEFIADLMSK